ncbi:MAG: (deoxy)nucleoside triphosphate pyrophosphohydrolase [Planctomycetota bacterium]
MAERVEVALGVVRGRGAGDGVARVLVSRRREAAVLGGFWEFPGGKVEENESPEACVVRELREELGIEVRPVAALGVIRHDYDHAAVTLRPYLCEWVGGEPEARGVAAWAWVDAGQLDHHRFPPANDGLLEEVRELLG